jgi:hypothetical protein
MNMALLAWLSPHVRLPLSIKRIIRASCVAVENIL